MSTQPKQIIFDFDGTLADSFHMAIDILYSLHGGGKKLTDAEMEEIRNLPVLKVLKKLKIPLWKVPSLLVKGRIEIGKHIDAIKPCYGTLSTLKTLKEQGHNLYIISSNSTVNIKVFLKNNDMSHYFTRVYGNVGVFGKAKVLRDVMRKNHIKPENCIYVGDEVRDIEAAKKVNVTIVSVTWGYNGAKILETFTPDHLVSNQAELIESVN